MSARSYSHISHAPATEWKRLYDSHVQRVAAMRAQVSSQVHHPHGVVRMASRPVINRGDAHRREERAAAQRRCVCGHYSQRRETMLTLVVRFSTAGRAELVRIAAKCAQEGQRR